MQSWLVLHSGPLTTRNLLNKYNSTCTNYSKFPTFNKQEACIGPKQQHPQAHCTRNYNVWLGHFRTSFRSVSKTSIIPNFARKVCPIASAASGTKPPSLTVSEIFNAECCAMVDMTLIQPLKEGQGHSFWYQSISDIRLPSYALNNNFCSRTQRIAQYTGWAKLSDTTLHFCLWHMNASTQFYDFWHI